MTNVNLTLNGKAVSADVPDNTLLVSFIRETMALTGTHFGCDTSQCGPRVFHVNGASLKSFTMQALAPEGA